MADGKDKDDRKDNFRDISADGPRLTPQGRTDKDGEGEDSTNPMGEGAKLGQRDKSEG
jgi:hypothetical protein